MFGITSFGAYLPASRLERSSIAGTLGGRAVPGSRAVASYDEDTTSMGVEAARRALAGGRSPHGLVFATSRPAYLDKTNATAIHAALGLAPNVSAYDMVGSVRSGIGALRAACSAAAGGQPTLAVLSDIRTGLPGGADEALGGDGAAALLCGTENVIAQLVAVGSATAEFLERWRIPGEPAAQAWEERFGEVVYPPLAEAAVADACKRAGITIDDVDRLIVAGVHRRAARRAAASLRPPEGALADDLTTGIGNTGCAHPGLLLAGALARAAAHETILLVAIADGADALVFQTTDDLAAYQAGHDRPALDPPPNVIDYAKFLTWRGMLRREPPRRPDPARPAAPPAHRSQAWKFGFSASRCSACGTRHLPPARVCSSCRAIDEMQLERLADVKGTVSTFTVDRLGFSLSPPVVAAVIDFDGGGRFQCELTDVDPDTIAVGDRVEMTFRRLFTAAGVHNYFWKARPAGEDRS